MSSPPPRVLQIAALGPALLVMAGCTASGPAAPAGPTPETVAWVDQVCTAMRPFADHIVAAPQPVGDDPIAALEAFVNTGADILDGTLSGLAAIGPSPVAGGDEIVDRMETSYTEQQAALRESGTQLAAVDGTDEAALVTAIPAALEGLPETFDPTAELRSSPELSPAVDQAASCTALPTTAG